VQKIKRQVILDTETTGLDPTKGHRLTEIGCLEMIDRRLTGRKFHTYLNPQREIEKAAAAITGLTT
jgi:DNA polymerase-3 subunit epsilon